MANETTNFNIGGIDHPVKDPNAYVKPSTGIPKSDLSQEVQDALDEAGSGDGTVTGVKMNNGQPIPPGENGVVDLGSVVTDVSNKVDKVTGYGLSKNDYTDADKTAVATIPSKANDADVVKSISVNNVAQQKNNGNVNIVVQGNEGKSAYQSYYDTTSDNPKMTEAQWAAAVLRSAYRSYLATTSDNPVMTEAQWVASLKGPKGDTGNTQLLDPTTFDPATQIINDLTTGGQTDALSAEMGKVLGAQVAALEDEVEDLDDGSYDISIEGDTLVINSLSIPKITTGQVGNNNLSCKAGNTATTSFYVSGRKLTSAIQIAVSDATNWSVSPATISPTNGKVALTLVTITYHPASGTAAGTSHNCTITISSTGAQSSTIAMTGTVAVAPTIMITPSALNISAAENTPETGVINVKGSALEGDITLAISGTGFTLSTNLVAKADAESAAGADVTVTFDGVAAANETITASSTNASSTQIAVNGSIRAVLHATSGYYLGNDLAVTSKANAFYTDTILVRAGQTFVFKGYMGANYYAIYKDVNGTKTGITKGTGSSALKTYTHTPSADCYIGVNNYITNGDESVTLDGVNVDIVFNN